MKSVIPILAVRDMHATLAFYSDVLGFETGFTMKGDDGELVHASVKRGGVDLMFGPRGDHPADRAGDGVVLYFTVDDDDDIDAEFAHARRAGASVVQEPTDQFWGHRDWIIRDPDGYQLAISKEVKQVDLNNLEARELVGASAD